MTFLLKTTPSDLRKLEPFAEDVLAALRRRKVTFKGCWADHVEINMNGLVKVLFYGHRNGRPWTGGIKFSCVFPEDNIWLADPAAVAELCEKGIALMDAG